VEVNKGFVRSKKLTTCIVLIFSLSTILTGCASSSKIIMGQAAMKLFETRTVDASLNEVFTAATEAMFDLGYTIKHSDKESGILVGERQDSQKDDQVAMAFMFGWAAAAAVRPIVYNLTLLVKPVDEKTSKVRIKTSIDGEPAFCKETIDKVWVYIERQVLMESPPDLKLPTEIQHEKK